MTFYDFTQRLGLDQSQQVGRYSVNFNGSSLASGVYFYRLVAGNHVITKKMLELK